MTRPSGTVRYDNHGRVVLVTGGGQGIGRSICAAFLDSGAKVVAVDIAPVSDPGWQSQQPAELLCLQADTSQPEQCERAVRQAVAAFGAIDVLVNNAAIQPPTSYHGVHELDEALSQRMLAVNFSGYNFMAKYALRQMLTQESGVVVNMASGQGHRTARGVPIYGPLKAANLLQTRQWGVEYARFGIRVVSVSPGAIRTPLVEASLKQQGGEAELANRHPLGRIGDPDEVARAVLWLASSDASFVTGTDLEVDGGLGALGAFADPYARPDHDVG